jgi:hypothetical protein
MQKQIVWRVLALAVLTLALSTHGVAVAQGGGDGLSQIRLQGLINDYTADLDGGGAWHIVGQWSAHVQGGREKATFYAALAMVRADTTPRQSHTHHVWINDGVVTAVPFGYQITGNAVATGSGNAAGFSGSRVTVTITGGNAMPFSNVSVVFGDGAAGHFGAEPVDGVVTEHR